MGVHLTRASADPPAGFAFDVQVERPGTSSFVPWQTGVTGQTATFGPSDPLWAGQGTYRFRARMRNVTNGKASGYGMRRSALACRPVVKRRPAGGVSRWLRRKPPVRFWCQVPPGGRERGRKARTPVERM